MSLDPIFPFSSSFSPLLPLFLPCLPLLLMDGRSASDSNDYTLAFGTMSSGSIAAPSSGYNGVNTDDTDPDLTFLTNLFPVGYSNVNYQARESNHLQSPLWQSDLGQVRLSSLAAQGSYGQSKPDFDSTIKGAKYSNVPFLGQYPMQLTKSEPFVPLSNYTYGYTAATDQSVVSRKWQYLTNINTPNFNPIVKEFKDSAQVAPANNHLSFKPDRAIEKTPLEAVGGDQVEMLRMELNFKNLVNKTLNEKLKSLTINDDAAPTATSPGDSRIAMPSNYYQLFRDLTRTLNERTQELEETKNRMEAILVGLVMNKDSSVSTDGTFDPQETAHRITTKLSILQKENETLLKMVSHGNKQSLLVELGLLKNENELLRKKLATQEKGA